jgi:hypothetical protein
MLYLLLRIEYVKLARNTRAFVQIPMTLNIQIVRAMSTFTDEIYIRTGRVEVNHFTCNILDCLAKSDSNKFISVCDAEINSRFQNPIVDLNSFPSVVVTWKQNQDFLVTLCIEETCQHFSRKISGEGKRKTNEWHAGTKRKRVRARDFRLCVSACCQLRY